MTRIYSILETTPEENPYPSHLRAYHGHDEFEQWPPADDTRMVSIIYQDLGETCHRLYKGGFQMPAADAKVFVEAMNSQLTSTLPFGT